MALPQADWRSWPCRKLTGGPPGRLAWPASATTPRPGSTTTSATPAQRHAARPRADLSMTAADHVPGTHVPAAEFRDAMGHFATGVTVITSVGADGAPVGTTANAVTSLSLDPPLILACFDLGSLTLRAIRGHGAFVVTCSRPGKSTCPSASPGAGRLRPGKESGTGTGRPAALASKACSPSWSARWSIACPAATMRSWSAACGTSRPALPRLPRSSSSAAVTPRWPSSRPPSRPAGWGQRRAHSSASSW